MTAIDRRGVLRLTVAGIAAASGIATATGLAPQRAAAGVPSSPGRIRGFNLPGMTGADGRPPSPDVLAELMRIGFNTARLPVDGDALAFGGRAETSAALRRFDDAMTLLTDAGLVVMADLHPAGRLWELLNGAPVEGAAAAVAAWESLRDVVADYPPEQTLPELLNEPPMERVDWLPLRQRLTDTIRARCPDHTIVWGASRVQGTWETMDTPPLDDGNAIAAVHFYWPMAFTHQCADWMGPPFDALSDIPFPARLDAPTVAALVDDMEARGAVRAASLLREQLSTPWEASAIADEFARLRQWSTDNACPVVLNEFGVLKTCAPPQDRRTWIRAVRDAAETNGMGWMHWELDEGFGLIEDRQALSGFDYDALGALFD